MAITGSFPRVGLEQFIELSGVFCLQEHRQHMLFDLSVDGCFPECVEGRVLLVGSDQQFARLGGCEAG